MILALFGPTAAGKSALAHAAAITLGGEIVVADPFQRYRGLEIAADAPSAAERAEVPYHLVGDLDVTQASSAAAYAASAHAAIDDVLARGRIAIVAGGTGLYLRAALAELAFAAEATPEIRRQVEDLVAEDLPGAIDELSRRDPEAAARIDLRNPRRVIRALELVRSGIAPPVHDRLWTEVTRHPTLLIGVTRPRSTLDALIARRVRRELADGLIREIEAALDTPGMSRTAAQIIGVREVRALRAGEIDITEMPELLAARTRKLARAQMTWLRKTPSVHLLDLGTGPSRDGLRSLYALWNRRS